MCRQYPQWPEEGVGSPGSGVIDSWDLPCGCCELNPVLLEEQPDDERPVLAFLLLAVLLQLKLHQVSRDHKGPHSLRHLGAEKQFPPQIKLVMGVPIPFLLIVGSLGPAEPGKSHKSTRPLLGR